MGVTFKHLNGQKVRDIVTGMVGIIDIQSITIDGCIMYSVQPQCDEKQNNRPDGYFIDEDQLEFVETVIKGKGEKYMIFKFDTGDRVKDKLTDFEGHIIRAVLYLNGCIHYAVQPSKLNKNGEPVDAHYFSEQRLEKYGRNKSVEKRVKGGPVSLSNKARM